MERPVFCETQPWWTNGLLRALMPAEAAVTSVILFAVAARSPAPDRWIILAAWLTLCVLLPGLFLCWRLVTVVTPIELRAGFRGTPGWRVPLDQIESARPVRIDPLRDFGGWGWRSSKKYGKVLNVAGRHAVVITTLDGRVRALGTQRPEELAVAVLLGATGEEPQSFAAGSSKA